MFSIQSDKCVPVFPYFDTISLIAAEFEEPKIGIRCKGLKFIILYGVKTWND